MSLIVEVYGYTFFYVYVVVRPHFLELDIERISFGIVLYSHMVTSAIAP